MCKFGTLDDPFDAPSILGKLKFNNVNRIVTSI